MFEEILKQLLAAEEPSREIDKLIAQHVGTLISEPVEADLNGLERDEFDSNGGWWAPYYTSSLDAARRLIPEEAGYIRLAFGGAMSAAAAVIARCDCCDSTTDDPGYFEGQCRDEDDIQSAEIALCIAALRAAQAFARLAR